MPVTVRRWEDPTSWNAFVASVPMAHFQQSWEWGELAPHMGGWPVRLAAVADGHIQGALQLIIKSLSGTGRTHLYVPRGPSLHGPNLEVLGPLLEGARAIGGENHAVGIRLEPNAPACSHAWKNSLRSLGLKQVYPPNQPRSSWVLDIVPEPEQLLRDMKQKTRYNIRLAAKKGVEVSEAQPGDLPGFYTLLRETAERDAFFIHSQAVYERMYDLFRRAGTFTMLQARYQKKLIAAVTLVRFGPTCWYLQGASSSEHRNLMATYLLQWEAINWAKRAGCALYDFRAVPDILREDQDMYGVYRFKEGFGGRQLTTLHTYGQAYNPVLFGLWQMYFAGRFKLDAWQRRRKGLPALQFA